LQFINTFEHHRNNPSQSFDDYYRSLKLELSNSLKGKKLVYLDTKFWVVLRNGFNFPSQYVQEKHLLDLAIMLVESDICVFPISEDVFMEVIKQTDLKTLHRTVSLIDQLSNGVSSINHEERIQLELLHYWYSAQGKEVYAAEDLAWTKLAYTMGSHTFEQTNVPLQEKVLIQKAFTDQMWSISMQDMIATIESSGGIGHIPPLFMADKINEGKFSHQNEAKSFEQMFLHEVAGWIDVYGSELNNMMEYMYEQQTGTKLQGSRSKTEEGKTKKLLGNTIYNLFRLNKVGKALPSIRIMSGLYAAVRWDKLQKFQDHDHHDFRHAATALPYCDYFFTEKRLTHLITQKKLSFDKLYGCETCSKIDRAIEILESLAKVIKD